MRRTVAPSKGYRLPRRLHRRPRPLRPTSKRPRSSAPETPGAAMCRGVSSATSSDRHAGRRSGGWPGRTRLEVFMNTRRWILTAVVVAAAAAWGGVASADMSRNVLAAFKGELVITKGELPEGKSDKDTIAKIKGERLKELTGEAKNDVTGWY